MFTCVHQKHLWTLKRGHGHTYSSICPTCLFTHGESCGLYKCLEAFGVHMCGFYTCLEAFGVHTHFERAQTHVMPCVITASSSYPSRVSQACHPAADAAVSAYGSAGGSAMSLAFLSLRFSSTRTFGSVLKSHALRGDKKILIKLNINNTTYSKESISSFEKASRTYYYL